jgi:hypothetical protein
MLHAIQQAAHSSSLKKIAHRTSQLQIKQKKQAELKQDQNKPKEDKQKLFK